MQWHTAVGYSMKSPIRLSTWWSQWGTKEGRISNNPQDSVYYALVTFLATGFLISSLRIILYLRTIKLSLEDDDDHDEIRAAISLWISLSKALFEAFPQTTIAQFYFGNCAQTGNVKTLVQAFDVFSIFTLVMFFCHSIYYYWSWLSHSYSHWLALSSRVYP